jgi:hypothetical protein
MRSWGGSASLRGNPFLVCGNDYHQAVFFRSQPQTTLGGLLLLASLHCRKE